MRSVSVNAQIDFLPPKNGLQHSKFLSIGISKIPVLSFMRLFVYNGMYAYKALSLIK